MFTRKRSKMEYGKAILLIAVLVTIIGTVFMRGIERLLLDEVESSLTESAHSSAAAINTKFAERAGILAALGQAEIVSDPAVAPQDKLAFLRPKAEAFGFKRVGVSDANGNAVVSDGHRLYVGEKDFFYKARAGGAGVSDDIEGRIGEAGDMVFHFVPVRDAAGRFIGTIFAEDRTAELLAVAERYAEDEKKSALVFAEDGTIISDGGNILEKQRNFFYAIYPDTRESDYANLKALIAAQDCGAGAYNLGARREIVGIAPISHTDRWLIAITSPAEVVMNKANKILLMAGSLVVTFILFVMGAVAYFYFFHRKYMEEKTTATETQRQLQKSASQLRVKDQFIANVSHEIRTPMNAIVGMTYFLRSTRLTGAQRGYLAKIESSTALLLGIINDILDLSKIREGKFRLQRSPFLIGELMRTVDDLFLEKMAEKHLFWRIENELENDVPVTGDRQRLTQIVVNLVNNAYKFTDMGKVVLSVRHTFINETYIELLFAVEDSGIGIARENLAKLFVPFEQLEETLTKVYEGTGLGLSIANLFVNLMDGRLWVDSKQGVGSKFQFTVKLDLADPKELELDSMVCEPPPDTLENICVLLVEDNEINAEIAGMLLEEIGVKYDWAHDGIQAVEMCREARADGYSLILMDIHMPNMDGYEAAKRIRGKYLKETPIVALTATVVDREIMVEHAEIDEYLLKPFDVDMFKRTVLRYVSLERGKN